MFTSLKRSFQNIIKLKLINLNRFSRIKCNRNCCLINKTFVKRKKEEKRRRKSGKKGNKKKKEKKNRKKKNLKNGNFCF